MKTEVLISITFGDVMASSRGVSRRRGRCIDFGQAYSTGDEIKNNQPLADNESFIILKATIRH